MKALIICSVHALCDISHLEQQAFDLACARQGIKATATVRDHAHGSMLDALTGLPARLDQRQSLIESYLGALNDALWEASIDAYQSVFASLNDPQAFARPTALVSDYPTLTTNLVRAAALLTKATRVGHLIAPSDAFRAPSTVERLKAGAAALNVSCGDIDVIVAQERDFIAAQSLGMHPRFAQELRPEAYRIWQSRRIAPAAPCTDRCRSAQPVAMIA